MRALLFVALVAAPLLAGCAGTPTGPDSSTDPTFADLGLKPTASTGIIRGVVVDEAIRPVAGAKIVLNGEAPRETATTADGLFGFADLAPGTYFLTITKLGYFGAQQSTEVVAGVADPSIVKVLLTVDVENQPFFEAFVYEGFVECTTSVLVLCGAPNLLSGQNITNDRFTWDQYLSDGADLIQSEMIWTSTQALSPQLYFEMEALNGGCDAASTFIGNAEGPSPIVARIDNETVKEFNLGQTCPIYYSIFAGDASGGVSPVGVGVTLQQSFDMYIHAFHGYLPPETWRFSSGEPVPQPLG
jgi:hypothetical protein